MPGGFSCCICTSKSSGPNITVLLDFLYMICEIFIFYDEMISTEAGKSPAEAANICLTS